ncbi:MAG: hypothetical protein AUJ72_01525 [Candidatus Omnitrophica bacterium CG1_02_46_14]|nr:MAG: hypothetical protein AUJ72_01525 [Candidatus Omnitrophica bacterium CG1_02_46_14]
MSQIIEALGCPVITTSANVSGQPSCYTVEEFEKQKQLQQASKQGLTLSDIGNWFSQGWPEGSEEMLVALDGGVIPPVPPSTVVKVIEGKWEVLREGRKRVIKSQSDRVMES